MLPQEGGPSTFGLKLPCAANGVLLSLGVTMVQMFPRGMVMVASTLGSPLLGNHIWRNVFTWVKIIGSY